MAIVYSILSLCLVGFLLFDCKQPNANFNRIQQRLDDSEQAREEVEQSLFVFADEIKEGNERVLQQVANHLDSNSHANDSTFETITEEANKLESRALSTAYANESPRTKTNVSSIPTSNGSFPS